MRKLFIELAEKAIHQDLSDGELGSIVRVKDEQVFALMAGADLVREHFFGREIHLCTICNAKSGHCSEDCHFCAQSAHFKTNVPSYPLKDSQELISLGLSLAKTNVHRYSLVTSGRGLSATEIDRICDVFNGLKDQNIHLCASLGIINKGEMAKLKQAGLTRYHHNLETAASFFQNICTTHEYDERIQTIKQAKEAGLSVCSGGIFGLGESDDQVVELAKTLKSLDVDAVPVNFLVPIPGTPLENNNYLTPLRCLRIICILRYILPDKEIIICGGRVQNLKELHPLVFYAGASGIMTGNYLTTTGRTLEEDLCLLERLGFLPRFKSS